MPRTACLGGDVSTLARPVRRPESRGRQGLEDLDREDSTLKRLLADAELEKTQARNAGGRTFTNRCWGAVERFACRVTGQHRATQRHQPAATTPVDPDAALRTWLRAYAGGHARRGFRPAYHDAHSEGRNVNHNKIQRLWREEGLRVPQRQHRTCRGTSTTIDAPTAQPGMGTEGVSSTR
jgi:hypothetical protein